MFQGFSVLCKTKNTKYDPHQLAELIQKTPPIIHECLMWTNKAAKNLEEQQYKEYWRHREAQAEPAEPGSDYVFNP